MSLSLGSSETTLIKLTNAYCSFVNGGKLIYPRFIDRIQDSEGNTIYNSENRECDGCDQISYLSNDFPKIQSDYKQIFSPETAYQMTSILEGVAAELRWKADHEYKSKLLENGGMNDGCN